MIHNISYRVFVYGTENEDKVGESLRTIFLEASPQREVTEGYYNNPVTILSQKFSKKREISDFIKKLNEMDDNEKTNVLNELDRKMDDKGNLFLRFHKQEAFKGNWKVVEHGDSIHIKIKIAAYPAKKEGAIKIAREIFG
jgi:RNA-binding protein